MTDLLPKELENKLYRIERYKDLLRDKYSLYTIQRDYNLPPKELLKYLEEIENKLLTDKKLTRDDRVYLNTFERVYQS
jgi:hypothetical protein